jgi:hypothetical protein
MHGWIRLFDEINGWMDEVNGWIIWMDKMRLMRYLDG